MSHVCSARFQTCICSGAHAPSARQTSVSAGQCVLMKHGVRVGSTLRAMAAETQTPASLVRARQTLPVGHDAADNEQA